MSKTYTNGEVTIVWKAKLCIHSENCVKGLPNVFDPQARPWINAGGAPTDELIAQVKKCPSGALSTYLNADGPPAEAPEAPTGTQVEVIPHGPLKVSGPVTLQTAEGSQTLDRPAVFLCRCGQSANKPFCDGAHKRIDFDG